MRSHCAPQIVWAGASCRGASCPSSCSCWRCPPSACSRCAASTRSRRSSSCSSASSTCSPSAPSSLNLQLCLVLRDARPPLPPAARMLLYGVAGPHPPASCFTQERAVGPRSSGGRGGVGSSAAVVGAPPHPAGPSLRTKQVCDITIAPFPRRTPPAKSFVSVLNKSLIQVSSRASA